MATISKVEVEISVVLGTTQMPIHQLLRMGRGAVIELEAIGDDQVKGNPGHSGKRRQQRGE